MMRQFFICIVIISLFIFHNVFGETNNAADFYHEVNTGETTALEQTETAVFEKIQIVLSDEKLQGQDIRNVRSFYSAFLDWDSRNQAGMDPIIPAVEAIEAIRTIEDLNALLTDPACPFLLSYPIAVQNIVKPGDSSSYIVSLSASSLFIGDDPQETTKKKSLFMTQMLRLGYESGEAEAIFENAFSFEARLFEKSKPSDFVMNPKETYALFIRFPFAKMIGSTPMKTANEFRVENRDELKRLDRFYSRRNLNAWKDCLMVRLLLESAPLLDRKSFDAWAECQGTTGNSDEKAAVKILSTRLNVPLARVYLQEFDHSPIRGKVTELTRELLSFFRTEFENDSVSDEETRQITLSRLDSITVNAVYPDRWADWSGLILDGLSIYDADQAIETYTRQYQWNLTNRKVDKGIWSFDAFEPCGFYDPVENDLNIPLGVFADIYDNEEMSSEEFLGKIGFGIARAIAQGFDEIESDGAEEIVDADIAAMKALLSIAATIEDFSYAEFFRAYARSQAGNDVTQIGIGSLSADEIVNTVVQQFDEFQH